MSILANDVHLLGSLDGTIQGYRADDGEVVASFRVPTAVSSSLQVHGESLYVGTGVPQQFGGGAGTNGLYAFRLGAEGTPPALSGTPAADATPAMEPHQEHTPDDVTPAS